MANKTNEPRETLRPSQQAALAFAENRPASMLAMPMGAGKTFTALALADQWDAHRTLVLCPASVRGVWRGQIPKHSRRDVTVCVLEEGSVKERTAQADAAWRTSPKPVLVCINYEAAWREPFRSWCLDRRWALTILDEGHRAQKLSRTACFVRELHDVSDRRLVLSGTPLTQCPISVWAQCRFLDPGVFGENLEYFKRRYENPRSLGLRKALKRCQEAAIELRAECLREAPRAADDAERKLWLDTAAKLDDLSSREWTRPERKVCGTIRTAEYLARLATIAYRCEHVLDLPPLTIERRTFRLAPHARQLYDGVAGGYVWEIDSGLWPDVQGSFAVTMRCQQITSGFLPDKDGTIVSVDSGKADLCRELLEEAGGEPVVVFCRFVEDLNRVQRLAVELGLRYGEISGRCKNALTERAELAPGVQVCGLQEVAGGAGIDLSAARIGIDYSPTWSLANTDQKYARMHRPPQSRPVIVYKLEAEDTIDGEVRLAIGARTQIVSGVWNKVAELAMQKFIYGASTPNATLM